MCRTFTGYACADAPQTAAFLLPAKVHCAINDVVLCKEATE